MRRVVLVDVMTARLDTVEGRLRGIREVSCVARTGENGALAALVNTDTADALRSLLENRIGLLPGVRAYRVHEAAEHAIESMFPHALA